MNRVLHDTIISIMDAFPVAKSKDEEKKDDYRTKLVTLEICDVMQESIRPGQPYQTRLDPLAAPWCFHLPKGSGAS